MGYPSPPPPARWTDKQSENITFPRTRAIATCLVVTVMRYCRYEQVGSHMLGYKGRKRRKPWKKQLYDVISETRYMDLTAFSASQILPGLTGTYYVIAAACSDGYVRSVNQLGFFFLYVV